MVQPWMETALRAAVSEIQRRNKERNHVLISANGDRAPVMTTQEMLKILRQFLESAQEGFQPQHAQSAQRVSPRRGEKHKSAGLHEPWAYAIETPGGDMYDGEYAIFCDYRSAKDRVDTLNDDLPIAAEQYKLAVLYKKVQETSPSCQEPGFKR